ncbi:MAG: GNAT family N-acetyltransferase [Acidimicrobiales bacterium]
MGDRRPAGPAAAAAPGPAGPAPGSRRPLVIANCSGFYGDRASAAREMVEGGPIDVLTGDYLAELTMLILARARAKGGTGYATTFLAQMEEVLGSCLDKGIKVVTNAGGLSPAACASDLADLAARLGLHPRIAHVSGDDVLDELGAMVDAGEPLEHAVTGQALSSLHVAPLTANAYLGGSGIARALEAGADVVVCPRVTDASVVVGPAAWWHGWAPDDLDCLAGAVVAGHVLECGAQATGGNYPFIEELMAARRPGTPLAPGFPLAEIASDGSCVITKHPGTGGLVSIGTVTAQLLYEIDSPRYLGPDVTARFDTVRLEQAGADRVRISGVTGEPPAPTDKVGINYLGGFKNTMTFALTGLDIEAKAALLEEMLLERLGDPGSFSSISTHLARLDAPAAPTAEQATAMLSIAVKSRDPDRVGREFSGAAVEMALSSYAGCFTTAPPAPAVPYGVYFPTLIGPGWVRQSVQLDDGRVIEVGGAGLQPRRAGPDPQGADPPASGGAAMGGAAMGGAEPDLAPTGSPGGVPVLRRGVPVLRRPLGTVCGARSGDKGGNANVGVWARSSEVFPWLRDYLSVERFKELVPEVEGAAVERYELANLGAVNFVVTGLLGEGVASSTRFDPQAKGLGEYLRSRVVDIPAELIAPFEAPPLGRASAVGNRHAAPGPGPVAGEPSLLRMRRATEADIGSIVAMLTNDPLGATRERPDELGAYLGGFERIDASPDHLLVVAERAGEVVGTLQLSFLPGLSHQGATRSQIEAVRVRQSARGEGIGSQMIIWAVEQSRRRGCRIVQLTSDASRLEAHRFYERLGFAASHVGFKLLLDGTGEQSATRSPASPAARHWSPPR